MVDPVQYQRRRDERDDVSMPLRSLHFGVEDGGLVTFLQPRGRRPGRTRGPARVVHGRDRAARGATVNCGSM